MSQGAVHRLKDSAEIVCRVQADLGADTPLLLCAPVIRRDQIAALVPRLHIELDIGGVPHVLLMSEMAAIPGRDLGPVLGHAGHLRDDIVAAVDLLVTGF